jgi:hypothetical protein
MINTGMDIICRIRESIELRLMELYVGEVQGPFRILPEILQREIGTIANFERPAQLKSYFGRVPKIA